MSLVFRLAHEPSRTLLLVQLAALLLYPWFDTGHGQGVLAAISVGVLSAAVWMVRRSPREAWIAALLAVFGIGAHAAWLWTGTVALGVAGAAGYAAAFFYSAVALVAYMMASCALQRRESRGGHTRTDYERIDPMAQHSLIDLADVLDDAPVVAA